MQVGSLGDVVFTVSDREILTVDSFEMSGSAKVSVHERHLQKGLSEFTGSDPDDASLKIVLADYLGADVQETLETLRTYKDTGQTVYLMIGDTRYGDGMWIITSYSISSRLFDRYGNLTGADVSVSLKEYL